MRNLLLILLITLCYSKSGFSFSTCILNFERLDHPGTDYYNKKVKNYPNIKLINGAKPVDLLECVDEGVENLVIIAHAGLRKNYKSADLYYFSPYTQNEVSQYVDKVIPKLQKLRIQSDRLEDELGAQAIYSNKLRKMKRYIVYYSSVIQGKTPLYHIAPFFPRIFKKLLNKISVQDQYDKRLKKIILVSCHPYEVLNRYSDIEKTGVEIRVAPKQKLMSWLHGKYVTSIANFSWIEKQIQE